MKLFTRLSFALIVLIISISANNENCAAQGAGRSALNKPTSIALDARGALYISDTDNHVIRRVTINDGLQTLVGTGKPGFSGEGGPAKIAQLHNPKSITIDHQGFIYFYDAGNKRIRRTDIYGGPITTILITGPSNWRDYQQRARGLNLPPGDVKQLAVDNIGKNLYFIYENDDSIYRLNLTNITVAQIVGDDKPAFKALKEAYNHSFQFNSIAPDNDGNIYATDYHGGFLLKIKIDSGSISVINTENKDLKVSANRLNSPTAITVDAKKNVYYVNDNRIWKLDFSENKKIAVAGNGKYGYGGDGELPLESPLNAPTSLAVDQFGTLYICDTDIHRIRYIDRNGTLMIFAD
jgi:sugar lactone lactonase YvrE